MLHSVGPANRVMFSGRLLVVNAKPDGLKRLTEQHSGKVALVGEGYDIPVSPTQAIKLQPVLTGKDATTPAARQASVFGAVLSTIEAGLAQLKGDDALPLPQVLSNLSASLGMLNHVVAPVVYATHDDITAEPALVSSDTPDQAAATQGALMTKNPQGFLNGFFPPELGIPVPEAPKPTKASISIANLMPDLSDLFGNTLATTPDATFSSDPTPPVKTAVVPTVPPPRQRIQFTPVTGSPPTNRDQVVVRVAGPGETAALLRELTRAVPQEPTLEVRVASPTESARLRQQLAQGTGMVAVGQLNRRPDRPNYDDLLAAVAQEFTTDQLRQLLVEAVPFTISSMPANDTQMSMIMAIHEAEKASGRIQTDPKQLKPGEIYGRQVVVNRLPLEQQDIHRLAAHVLTRFERYGHQRVSAVDELGYALSFDLIPSPRGWRLAPATPVPMVDQH